ncbi:MAG: hypothetical protein KAI83_10470 [Thiomargarita sp.]|nr:hypothetical protein [Thiomargarita sp.]
MHEITRATIKDCPYIISSFVGAIPCGCPKVVEVILGTFLKRAFYKNDH